MITEASNLAPPRKPRSGGPHTPEGKLRSRRGALKHGLRAQVVLLGELAERVARRTDELTAEWKPEKPYQVWLVGEAARASAQLDCCAELAVADLRRLGERAADPALWAADRRLEAEALGSRLSKDPG